MSIDKDELIINLMEMFYKFTLEDNKDLTKEYYKGYRKGMLDIIEAINCYKRE